MAVLWRTFSAALTGIIAAGVFLLPAVASTVSGSVTPVAEPCVNGVWPLNPYVVNCNLQPRQSRVLGSAPDAGALIACNHNAQCLSLYVNGGYGWYPGAVLVPGYHP